MTCPICHHDDHASLGMASGPLLYCRHCFHAWRPTPAAADYGQGSMCTHDMNPARYESQIAFVGPFIEEAPRVLEIGCTTGALAAAFRRHRACARYDAIEMSPAAEAARPHLDALYVEPLPALLARAEPLAAYDLVLMSHVLEHLDDLSETLQAIRRVLTPGGCLFIEIPNRSGNRLLPFDDNPFHQHFFTPTSIGRLLADQGFEIASMATGARHDARCTDAMRLIAHPFALPVVSRTLLSDHPLIADATNIVVWGADGLVENLLANFFDVARIDVFIDRNAARRNGSCLGRPVRMPDTLGTAPRTILINSVDFADSIAADIARLTPGVTHRVIRMGDLLS